MNVTVVKKVLEKFDPSCEVKINKTPLHSGNYGYYWSFRGKVNGVDTSLKLSKLAEGKYSLLSTVTKTVEEIIVP